MHWFADNFAPSSMPNSLALTYDPCQLFPALYGAFSCRDLPHIPGLPVSESCAIVTCGHFCPRALTWWQKSCAKEGRAPRIVPMALVRFFLGLKGASGSVLFWEEGLCEPSVYLVGRGMP